jgi:hypothetical protein
MSIYLTNKSFNLKVSITLFKALYNRRLNINYLRVFSLLIYVYISKELID